MLLTRLQNWKTLQRSCSSFATRSSKACCEIVRHVIPWAAQADVCYSAANDFWGKTYMGLTGQKKMTQELAIITGSSAGATESFVVVPFELVKIK